MADTSSIEWTDATWTPVRARFFEIQNDGSGKERIGWHCEHVSEGCRNCYAERMNRRLGTGVDFKPGELFREERKGYHNGEVKLFLDDNMLTAPLRWKKPRMIFVCSMTDLFADFVPDAWIDRVFAVMALSPQHTFQVLTKRAARMREYLDRAWDRREQLGALMAEIGGLDREGWYAPESDGRRGWAGICLPLPNVWLGVSAERQQEADERIPDLLATPAAIRFVSLEPLLGPIDLKNLDHTGDCRREQKHGIDVLWKTTLRPRLDWVIVGGESGPDARPMHPDWARALRDQCAAAGTAFFFKQWGGWAPARDFALVPSDRPVSVLPDGRVREWDAEFPASRLVHPDMAMMLAVGKKRAGRLLDGVEHNVMPEHAR